jgi:poly(3-hydroxybutyrate) depolymerase
LRWYSTRGRKVLEYWLVDGLGHAWSGGRKGGSFSDPDGPRATTLMWAFLPVARPGPAGRAAVARAAGA